MGKKTPVYLKTDLAYRLVTYNLLTTPGVTHLKDKSASGRFAFTIEDDLDFIDVVIQVTSTGCVNIYPPEEAPKDRIVEKVLKLLSGANQAPVNVLRKQKAQTHRPHRTDSEYKIALKHSKNVLLGLEAILAEDWALYRHREPSAKRAKWMDKIQNEGYRYKEFAIEHLQSGYPDTYKKFQRWRTIKREAKKSLLNEGNTEEKAEAIMNFATLFDGGPKISKHSQDLLDQRTEAYKTLESDIELIRLKVENGKPLHGTCHLCSD